MAVFRYTGNSRRKDRPCRHTKAGKGHDGMEAVITDAKRTIFARENGLLKDCLPENLAAPLIRYLSRNMAEDIDEVLIGNATGRGGNLARLSALTAGLPLSVPGTTIDRQCGSGWTP